MKLRLIAFLSVFGLTVAAAIVGNVLESKGILVEEEMAPHEMAAFKGLFFGFFCLLCLTIIPLGLRIFISGQVKIGNGERGPIRWLQANENRVVLACWAFFFLGLAIIYALAGDQLVDGSTR